MTKNINEQFFTANRVNLLMKYPDQYVVIADGKFQGTFDDNSQAYLYGAKRFSPQNFIIRYLSDTASTARIYSHFLS